MGGPTHILSFFGTIATFFCFNQGLGALVLETAPALGVSLWQPPIALECSDLAVGQKTGIPKWIPIGKWKHGPKPGGLPLRSFNFEPHLNFWAAAIPLTAYLRGLSLLAPQKKFMLQRLEACCLFHQNSKCSLQANVQVYNVRIPVVPFGFPSSSLSTCLGGPPGLSLTRLTPSPPSSPHRIGSISPGLHGRFAQKAGMAQLFSQKPMGFLPQFKANRHLDLSV